MIPKTIHYCWFGNNPKSELIKTCIASWHTTCPDFEIIEWNESNSPIASSPFATKMYQEKRWAFVADYIRLHVLIHEGGIYLDTDMLLLQSLAPLTTHTCVLGEESIGIISAGMIGAEKNHPFIKACKKLYDDTTATIITIPRVLTSVYTSYDDKASLTVYPPRTFYPYDSHTIAAYKGQPLGTDVIGVHLWNYSWGHPLNKLFKSLGIHKHGTKLVELLGIKQLLKKIFGFI